MTIKLRIRSLRETLSLRARMIQRLAKARRSRMRAEISP
jgi:hypothetical protein